MLAVGCWLLAFLVATAFSSQRSSVTVTVTVTPVTVRYLEVDSYFYLFVFYSRCFMFSEVVS